MGMSKVEGRVRLYRPLPRLRGRDRAGKPRALSKGFPSPQTGEECRGRARRLVAYAVVLSNTPPEAFSLRASSAYSDSTSLRSESPVLASGIDTILRPLR